MLLATGCRERPRAARLVPGGRPPGVMTTGELQQRVYLHGQRLPGRALVVGAEHVSFSAMVTLAHAGADVLALVTDQPRHQSYAAFALAAAARWRVPVWTSTAVRRIAGRDRLEGVELADLRTGATRFVGCDTVVFTGDWIPDHELARLAGTELDPGTRGPAVDTTLETSVPGVFAAGNLVHAAETADVAAAGGRHAARHIAAALRGGLLPRGPRIPVTVAAPLRWISPNAIRVPVAAAAARALPAARRRLPAARPAGGRGRMTGCWPRRGPGWCPGGPPTWAPAGWPGPTRPRARYWSCSVRLARTLGHRPRYSGYWLRTSADSAS